MLTKPFATALKAPRLESRLVARVLVALVWASVAWVLSLLIHRFVLFLAVPPIPPLGGPGLASSDQSAESRPLSALERSFGAASISSGSVKSADIQLVGLIEAGTSSVVSVRIRNGPTRALRLGQADSDGWRLESVKNGEIEISRSGEVFRLASYPSRTGLSIAID